MNITHAPVRRSLVAAVALGAGLTLAACGGGDEEESTSEEAPPAEEETSEEEVPSDGGSETGSSGAGETESESDAGALPPGGESESEAGSAGPGGESGSGATGEERIEITVPEGWEDATEMAEIPPQQGIAEAHAYALMDSETFATNVTALRYEPGVMSEDQGYIEMLEASGTLPAEHTELEPREIAGNEAQGVEIEQDLGTGPVRQHAYGVALDDGSFVEIVLSSSAEEFDANQADFDSILDSIEIS